MTLDEYMDEFRKKHKVWYDAKRDCLVSNAAFVIYELNQKILKCLTGGTE